MNTEWIEEVPVNVMLDSIFPYLMSYHFVIKGSTPSEVNNEHLIALGGKWKINASSKQSKLITSQSDNFDLPLLQALYTHTEVLDSRRAGRRVGGGNSIMLTADKAHTLQTADKFDFEPPTHKFKELERNYFGLPIYALDRTAEGIVYQARKPYDGVTGRFNEMGREGGGAVGGEEEAKSLVEKTEVKTQNRRWVHTCQIYLSFLISEISPSVPNEK